MPFKAESALASLIKRTQERAVPVSDHDGTIPGALSEIVSKCLERDPDQRYQNAAEMLRDLDAWQGKRAAATLGFHADVKPWGQTIPWPLLAGIATVIVLAVVGYMFRGPLFSPSQCKDRCGPGFIAGRHAVPERVGRSSTWDWLGPSLADMLSTDVGQSSHLRTVSPDRVQQVLPRPADCAQLRRRFERRCGRIAEFTNADTLVCGQYARLGDQIRIDATLQDLKHNRTIQVKSEAANQQDLSAAVDRLAGMHPAESGSVSRYRQGTAVRNRSSLLRIQWMRCGTTTRAATLCGREIIWRHRSASRRLPPKTPQFALPILGWAKLILLWDTTATPSRLLGAPWSLSQDLPLGREVFHRSQPWLVLQRTIRKRSPLTRIWRKAFPTIWTCYSLWAACTRMPEISIKLGQYYDRVLKADSKNLDALLAMGRVEIKVWQSAAGTRSPRSRAAHRH